MTCPVCNGKRTRVVSSRVTAGGDRLKRYECAVCRYRWGSRNGTLESHLERWTEIDWRVPAVAGACQQCVHYLKGFCSLGLPEARDPGFVTECEARVVQSDLAVIQ